MVQSASAAVGAARDISLHEARPSGKGLLWARPPTPPPLLPTVAVGLEEAAEEEVEDQNIQRMLLSGAADLGLGALGEGVVSPTCHLSISAPPQS